MVDVEEDLGLLCVEVTIQSTDSEDIFRAYECHRWERLNRNSVLKSLS
jgi:hypothetical protein